jgi:predicted RNA polymerase sigma factor
VSRSPEIEGLLREAAPRALAAVLRRFGDFADSEDAVQEALIEAAEQWPPRAIAAAMVDGPDAGLELLAPLGDSLAGHHRLHATRAHLLEIAGEAEAAIGEYEAAANRTASLPEQHYLLTRAARLGGPKKEIS